MLLYIAPLHSKTRDLADLYGDPLHLLARDYAASYQDIAQLAENRDIRQMILAAASDRTRATTDYREVFENYRRMMRTFLYTRNLPGGQAEYIDRYFRVIHPTETEKKDEE